MTTLGLPRSAGGNQFSPERRPGIAAFRVAAVALFLWGAAVQAQTITVSGSPGTISIQSAVAGEDLTDASNSATTYGVRTRRNRPAKITATLSTALPAGVTMRITLAEPSGATSAGAVTLTTVAQDVVTNIPGNVNVSGLTITYELSSTLAAGDVALTSRTVTLTIIEI